MSRVDVKKPSRCSSEPLTKEAVSHALSVFSKILMSCYGPTGRFKQLHNGVGGCVRTTSQSSALLSGLSVTHPVLKLLTASVQNHLAHFSDCGLFTAILCCSLLEKAASIHVAPCLFIKISCHLLNLCIDYLGSEACGCRVPVDFSNSKVPLSLVRSILTSKRACSLSRKEADHISTLVLKAFLFTIPQSVETRLALGKCLYIPVKNRRVLDSAVYPGLLIEIPESHPARMLPVKRATSCTIKMVLFCVSLSGDLAESVEGVITVCQGVSLEAAVLQQLLALGKQIVRDGVSLVVCQKVIHPALRQYLMENHVVAVERVGIAVMEPLKQMTGSQPVASLQILSPTCYGHLKDLQTLYFASKWFLHLIPNDPIVCSLMLCNRNETTWDELKLACQTAEHALQFTISDPWVLLGGGCTETHLSSYIRHASGNVTISTLEDLCCSWADFQLVADGFCRSLASIAHCLEHDGGDSLIDTDWGHFWPIPPDVPSESDWSDVVWKCGCGLCDKQQTHYWRMLRCPSEPFLPKSCINELSITSAANLILDCFAAKRNGLQVAVETAHLLLDLSYIIEDSN
ncbi:McKusick-Kaufman/Bardet-Biedl syndromes putative chaperonin-like isoform X1 [Varanus komodoensis]|uniref:McKusick-Kaufman/Bardet-Biedl syndromes putative chaperonin-like isoform X1 n=1 Tax=Varanus komodoensis TaxID=61221 RepID=UPI001CF7D53F|nr:McKusick-Kaufman/Bardet-Biedl syndromes putative chaperonin-like isoform X1 [Varanus komodoensis]